MAETVPLSSMDIMPLTEETRQRLIDAGVDMDRAGTLSELGAQSLLALHQHVNDDEGAHAPVCFTKEYFPMAMLCMGCVYQPRCWRADARYLKLMAAGKVEGPPGVPDHVVRARMNEIANRPQPAPPPPRKRKAAPSPPPTKRKAPPPPPRRKVAPPLPPPRKP